MAELMLSRFNKWLADLPTTNWIRLVGSFLIIGTGIVVWVLALRGNEWDHFAFGEWLIFLAALEGINYRQFKAKRESDYGYLERKNGNGAEHAGPKPE